MDSKFKKYYTSVGMGETLNKKMSAFHDQLKSIGCDTLQDVVISEYITDNGERQYINAIFFTTDFVYEIERFLSDSPTIWIAKLIGNVGSYGLTPKDYNFTDITQASRLNLHCIWTQGLKFELLIKTSKENCNHLLKLVNKYFKPNLS